MILDAYRHVYFVGIGGIGMSAIARYFHAKGVQVSGYDRTRTHLTIALEEEGMSIHYTDDTERIPDDVDLVIYTPAIPKDHKELNWLKDHQFPVMKRSEALGIISREKSSVCIAGTHGKTTTSSMVTHVLKHGDMDITAFVGGLMVDYDSNFLIGRSDVAVLEADEYDRSFLQLDPYISVITSMDPDHLDIYGDKDTMDEGFKDFAARTRDNGYLIIRYGLLKRFNAGEISKLRERKIRILEYGEDTYGDIRIHNFRVEEGFYTFDYEGLGYLIPNVAVNMPGRHNAENACVAITVGLLEGIEISKIKESLRGFKGIHRRFERIFSSDNVEYIDDYAHHPGELKAAIDAARKMYPGRWITGVFQPHLYSRTRDFADGFAEELDKLDEIILLDIYPARELPIEGVRSEMIFDLMKNPNKKLATKATLMEVLEESELDVLMTLGAGDIDIFVQKIKEFLTERERVNLK